MTSKAKYLGRDEFLLSSNSCNIIETRAKLADTLRRMTFKEHLKEL